MAGAVAATVVAVALAVRLPASVLPPGALPGPGGTVAWLASGVAALAILGTVDGKELSDRRWGLIAAGSLGVLAVVVGLLFLFGVRLRGPLGLSALLVAKSGVVVGLFGLITQFGDPWFLLLAATVAYLYGTERSMHDAPRDGALVLATVFAAFALTDLLKNAFTLPRPAGAGTTTPPVWLPAALEGVFRNAVTGTGYAFPSGHALGSTAAYGALAHWLDVGDRRLRWATAAVVVAGVVLSRVVLGVHFVVDIVAGVAAGLVLLATMAWISSDHPTRAFGVAVAVGVAGVVASAVSPAGVPWKAGQWLGAAVGGGLAWVFLPPKRQLALTGTVAAGTAIGVLWLVTYTMAPPLLVTVVATAVAAGGTIAAPRLAGEAEEKAGTGAG